MYRYLTFQALRERRRRIKKKTSYRSFKIFDLETQKVNKKLREKGEREEKKTKVK